jgi:stress-induced morphogen
MDTDTVAERIAAAIPDAEVEVTTPRDPDDDDHYAAVVVSPVFEGEPLVDRHQRVHDAIDDELTVSNDAIDTETYTPAEYEEGI